MGTKTTIWVHHIFLPKKKSRKNLSKNFSPLKGEEEEEEEEDARDDDDDDDPAWHRPRARKTRRQLFEVVRVLEQSKCSQKDLETRDDDDDGDHPFGAAKAYLDCREGNRDVERGDRDGEDVFHGRNVERG